MCKNRDKALAAIFTLSTQTMNILSSSEEKECLKNGHHFLSKMKLFCCLLFCFCLFVGLLALLNQYFIYPCCCTGYTYTIAINLVCVCVCVCVYCVCLWLTQFQSPIRHSKGMKKCNSEGEEKEEPKWWTRSPNESLSCPNLPPSLSPSDLRNWWSYN